MEQQQHQHSGRDQPGARPSARGALALGGLSLLVCIVAYVGQTTVTRQIQQTYVQPYFILWVAHSCWMAMLPLHAAFERLKRNPRSLAALRAEVLVASAMLIVQRRRRPRPRRRQPTPPGEYQPLGTADADADAGANADDDSDAEADATAASPRAMRRSGEIELVSAAKGSGGPDGRPRGRSDDDDDDDEDNTGSSSGAANALGSNPSLDARSDAALVDAARALALARPGWVLWRTALLAALLATLLNASAYLWYVAVGLTTMSKVTATNNTTCFFAYLFSVLLLNERVRLVKCLAVAASIVGVAVMALVHAAPDGQSSVSAAGFRSELLGDLLSLACACGLGLYQVLYKKYAVPRGFHSLFAVNFTTALLGLCTLAVCWPPLPALHAAGIERFHWPSRAELGFIALNALLGIAYNACYMIALVVTSPLFAAIGIMLTIPIVAVVDMVVQGHVLAWNVFAGGAAILAGFCALTYAEYRDSVRKAPPPASHAAAAAH
ncbi:hypothetical protein H4R18_003507 [Coemansia javaensis]|uniref:EamA domain-containing protein n=1 Tax=Coemansia javaensis TaxID=2761396 RepID=A0A9W8H8V9_9FUNG|nr:hypothetical protein H4R18_003507 [Coemansia javaensis]